MIEEAVDNKKLEALEGLLKKKFGKNYYGIKGNNKLKPISWISTGIYALDYVFGKGLPVGKIVELAGWQSSGKSLIATTIAAKYQSLNKTVFWIEAGESSLDREFAAAVGLNVDQMGILTADSAENGADAIREILKSGVVDLLILDSVAGLAPEKEKEDSLADANMALLARLLSKALKQYTTLLEEHQSTLLVINQIRMKPGVMYGNPEIYSGGNALQFFSHIIAKVTKTKVIEKDKNKIGIISRIKTEKNKCCSPFREKELHIMFPYADEHGEIKAGIDILEDLIPEAIAQGIITQKGASYTWRETKIYSRDKVVEYFKSNPELLNLLREDLLNNNGNINNQTEETDTEEDIIEE